MNIELLLVTALALIAASYVLRKRQSKRRQACINNYRFPKRVREKVKQHYPHLTDAQLNRVMRGLKEFFILCAMAKNRMVAMPSQAVDMAWHEFILFTREYQAFCKNGLGRFLHHTPAEAMRTSTQASESIRRAWRLSCAREKLNPKRPPRLPLLFALDAELNIPDGFRYVKDCTAKRNADTATSSGCGGYCGSHIGCSSGCAGDYGGEGSDSADSSDSGGCGGDSGGGCGGGGD